MKQLSLAVLVGSLRRESKNLALARALERLGQERFAFRYLDLNLPLYNDDLWADPPAGVLALKRELGAADAALFVTPELNRSIPAAIKNAVDWGSRPWGQNSWAGKPVGIVGTSPGAIGSAVAQSHLRSIIVAQETIVMGQPEVYVVSKPGLIDLDGTVNDDTTRKFLTGYLDRLAGWIDRHGGLETNPVLRPAKV